MVDNSALNSKLNQLTNSVNDCLRNQKKIIRMLNNIESRIEKIERQTK